jgi:hypothetical protein
VGIALGNPEARELLRGDEHPAPIHEPQEILQGAPPCPVIDDVIEDVEGRDQVVPPEISYP